MINSSADSPANTAYQEVSSRNGLTEPPEGLYSLEKESRFANREHWSASFQLMGRQAQFQRITQVLASDGDLLIVGVPGSGRRTLVRRAANDVGATIL
ncbi:MAG TPA: hypothetical protein V6C95_04750, partial [Coleofasciculaceae cyanobacterium]